MTENKSLKRRVRQRMSTTGERYTAARRQVLDKRTGSASTLDERATGEPLHGPTDRSWSEWVAVLDASGAASKSHTEIARWLGEQHGVPPWWAQDITVRYEKHIGRRVLGQRGATFSATASKTIRASLEAARSAWTDEKRRTEWLPDVSLSQRPTRAHAAARFDADVGRVVATFDRKGEDRVAVSVEHEKLPDAATAAHWTARWRERLVELKRLLEG